MPARTLRAFKTTEAKMAKFRVGPPAPSAGHRADMSVLAGPLLAGKMVKDGLLLQARVEEDSLGV